MRAVDWYSVLSKYLHNKSERSIAGGCGVVLLISNSFHSKLHFWRVFVNLIKHGGYEGVRQGPDRRHGPISFVWSVFVVWSELATGFFTRKV